MLWRSLCHTNDKNQGDSMRSRSLFFVPVVVAVTFSFTAVFSNPVPLTQYILLSEVQVIDSTHWTIEFAPAYPPLSADSVTNQIYLVYNGISPQYRPIIHLKKNGYGLITPQDYPTIRLHSGDTVRLRRDLGTTVDTFDTWPCVIDRRIKPTQSMAAYQWAYTDPLTLRKFTSVQWCIDASPTIGFANDSVGIFGVIRVYVCSKEGVGIPNAAIGSSCSIFSDKNSYFYFSNLLSYYTATFTIAGTTFGPFTSEPGCTTNVTCRIDSSCPVGTLIGFACDKDSQPLINSWIFFHSSSPSFQREIFTDSSGHFNLSLLPAITQLFLSVGDMISGPQDYGPYSIIPGCTTSVICKTPPPVSVHTQVLHSPISSLKIVGITKNKTSAIIVFNGGNESGDYDVAIFSLSGKKVFSSIVSNTGSGTYSVNCNTGFHPGTYIARLRSQSTSVEKRFTIK
jgi:hypothetical protein